MAEMNKDVMEKLKEHAMEALEVYAKKDSWKQEDLDAAKDAVKLYNDICEAQMKDGIWDEMKGDWGTSGYTTPHGYTRVSYGRGMHDDYSGARGRDSMGRYTSRGTHDNMYYDPRYEDHGMSGHSVKDRMIAALEEQMDNAKTEYEREEVRKAIAEIERMKR
jgi:hypothetical protein